jgi:hypothetical protein
MQNPASICLNAVQLNPAYHGLHLMDADEHHGCTSRKQLSRTLSDLARSGRPGVWHAACDAEQAYLQASNPGERV